uniref:Zinc metalloproteinase nas-32 n=1 Tax=Caenorhabditis elegans TaxID=6239 RepID=NAS32_CAEEL|nr:RecName: Full=Zinc metalloproteinase nas-32; AltName: Full=Nematode astacin 32; Flags: Precursor [Caenorhabditis elegans]
MRRFFICYIGFLSIFLDFILADKDNNSEEERDRKFDWKFENENGKPEHETVTVPKLPDGSYFWKWTWNSRINSTTAATPTSTVTTSTSAPTTSPRVYKLKSEARKSLRKALRGVPPEKRKKQLKKMGKKMMKIPKITKKESNKLHKSYRKVKITENPPALDMFEVNERAGLNEYLFQGDINLNNNQIAKISSEQSSKSRRKKRQIDNLAQFWPGKVVYYYFDSGLTTTVQQIVRDAITFLESNTCLKFELNSTATNRIFSGVGCYSDTGMLGGEQTLSLGYGCEVTGTAAHEIAHTLGLFHTQMRSDRDDYVTIDLTDVPESSQQNFIKLTEATSTNLVDYEYGSFMHYSGRAFVSSGGVDSIVPKDPVMVYTMGGRIVTFLDLKMLNTHYSCSCPTILSCGNGGFTNPANCSVCICPYGFGGALCTERTDYGCGSTLTATDTWQQETYTFGNASNSATARPSAVYCNHWIQAPVGKQIQFRIDSTYNTQCVYGCTFNGVEPKLKSDMTITQARYCCDEFNAEIMTADFGVNPMPVFSFNRYYKTTYTWSYRYVDSNVTACADTSDKATCLSLKSAKEQGCSIYDTAQLKVMCAATMDLCGKVASDDGTCKDRFPKSQCSTYSTNGMCTQQPPLAAEFSCAETCGFCTNPV